MFSTFSAQVTLLQAHLSHATGQTERALSLYRASHYLALQTCSISASSRDLAVAAKLGEMGLMIGLGRMAEVRSECEKVAKGCWGNGTGWMNDERNASGNGTPKMEASGAENVVLKIAGGLLLALMEKEILRSKFVFFYDRISGVVLLFVYSFLFFSLGNISNHVLTSLLLHQTTQPDLSSFLSLRLCSSLVQSSLFDRPLKQYIFTIFLLHLPPEHSRETISGHASNRPPSFTASRKRRIQWTCRSGVMARREIRK